MATKHPSSRSVVITIIAILLVIAVAAYGLGVMNMKKESPTTETTVEEPTANTTKVEASHVEPAPNEPMLPDPEKEAARMAAEAKAKAASFDGSLLAPASDDVVLGKAEAPVTIVEYSSLSCPHCAHFHEKVLPELQTKFLDTGKAKLILRAFPLNAPALKGALLVDCVKQEDKAKFIKVLFSMQEKWAFSEGYLASLKQIAAVGGVSSEAFDTCMKNKPKEDAIIKKVEEASKKLDIQGTPTFFINGTKYDQAPNADDLGAAIEHAEGK